jgi:hypothetical protein
VLVYCLSRVLDVGLAREFGCDTCVEIVDGEAFGDRLRAALEKRPGNLRLIHRPVAYYDAANAPGVDWALPEVMVFSKLACYSRQSEYRFAFARPDVFELSGTTQELVFREPANSGAASALQPTIVHVGDIRELTEVHDWSRLTSGCS